jgi:hypothetical protein
MNNAASSASRDFFADVGGNVWGCVFMSGIIKT